MSHAFHHRSGPPIRASELAQFAYCQRAWWLESVLGYPSDNVAQMDSGTQVHRAHGHRVAAALDFQRAAWVLLAIGALLLAIYFLPRLWGL